MHNAQPYSITCYVEIAAEKVKPSFVEERKALTFPLLYLVF